MAKTNSRYTYVTFGNDVLALLDGEGTTGSAEQIREKAIALIATQEKKSAYNAANPKKVAPKGASEKTQAVVDRLVTVLGSEPLTTADINAALGASYTPLQVANAIKFVPNWAKATVVRDVVSPKGLKSQKEYTAYYLTEVDGEDEGAAD